MCFHCGKSITGEGMPVDYHGNSVVLHPKCKKAFRAGDITARAVTSETGSTYVDDEQRYSTSVGVMRLVHTRPGDRE